MPYEFFFSYARRNRNADLDRFFRDLCDRILLQKHIPDGEVGFLDGQAIETGAPWKEKLAEALKTSGVMLAVCSPDYINSEYCGKEFQVFLERTEDYKKSKSSPTLPNVIIPVLWGKPGSSLRDVISQFQYTDDAFPAIYGVEGLSYMMGISAHADDYQKFVTRLAEKIAAASKEHPLPALKQLRAFDNVDSAFNDSSQFDADQGDRAWFVFVAARPGEFGPPRTAIDRYGKRGGKDWRPFLPASRESVGLLAQTVASQYDRYYAELPVDAALLEEVKRAQINKEPVVVLVDAWTLRLHDYRARMEELDKYISDTCAIVIPWNAPDPETEANRETLKSDLAKTFTYKAAIGRPLHYWGEVESSSDLRSRLLEMLAHYTNRAIETNKAVNRIEDQDLIDSVAATGVAVTHPPLVENKLPKEPS